MRRRNAISFILISCLVAIAACSSKSEGPGSATGAGDVKTPLAKALATPGAIVVDVRSKSEWQQGHIPGAIHVPVEQIEAITSRIPDKSTQIIVHCATGVRSAHATKVLAQLGYTRVFDAKTPHAVANTLGTPLR